VGNQPAGVALYENAQDPTKNRTYVINQYDKTVSVIDTNPTSSKYNQVVGTIKLASTPSDIVVNSTGTRAYVTMKGNASVAVIDTAAMKVVDVNPETSTVDSIKVGSTPAGIAISPDDKKLYVTNGGSSTVSVIDTTLNKEVSRITVGSQPSGIAVSPDGQKLYVTLRYADSLATVNLANNAVSTVKVGDSPRQVALTPDGKRAFVTNYDGTVSVVDTTTNTQVAKIVTGGPKYQPAGVAISSDGTLAYVANGKDTVSVFDTKTNSIIRTVTIDSAAESGPHYVALSADGTRIYVTDLNDDNVRTLSLTRGNTAPLAIADPTKETNPNTGVVSGLVNLKDPDGDAVTLTTVSGPTNGTVSYNTANGTYTYTPTFPARQQAGQGGPTTDTFTVRATDPSGAFKDASVTVPISPVGTIPVTVTAINAGSSPYAVAIRGNTLYVASDKLYVIDKTTNQVISSVPGVGSGPVVVSPDGGTAYVGSAYGGQSVYVVNTNTGQVAKTIDFPLGETYNGTWDLAMSPDGSKVYVALGDSSVAVIDTTSNEVVSTTPVSFFDGDMELSPDGSLLYGTTVQVIHTATMSSTYPDDYINTSESRGYWTQLAVSPDGKRLYQTDVDGYLLVVDTDPTHTTTYHTQIATITIPAGARDVALSPDGTRAYVAAWDGRTVTVVDTSSNTVIGIFTTDQSGGPTQDQFITVDPATGKLYIVDVSDGKVYAVTVGSPTV
jgi:YVTN family beta-propeller protein/VCBS repeat-containing protein